MDILVLLVFLLCYGVCGLLTLFLHYYYRLLFPGKGKYGREELIGIKSILKQELDSVFSPEEKQPQYLAFVGGSVIGYFLSFLGGIYGEHYESYFFHSAALPVLLYVAYGYIKKLDVTNDLPGFIKVIFRYDFSIFIGFTLSTLAKAMMVYGMYHVISFIWLVINILGLFFILVTRIEENEKKEDYKLFFRRKSSDN